MTQNIESFQLLKQVGAAAFYGASSLLIIMVNKAVLTSYGLVFNIVGWWLFNKGFFYMYGTINIS